MVKLLSRPVAPAGPVPTATTGQVGPKARSQSGEGSRPLLSATAQHERPALADLHSQPLAVLSWRPSGERTVRAEVPTRSGASPVMVTTIVVP